MRYLILAILVVMLAGCGDVPKEPKVKYKQWVEVKEGFYSGCQGIVENCILDVYSYNCEVMLKNGNKIEVIDTNLRPYNSYF